MSDMKRAQLQPISTDELATLVGNPRRARLYATQARSVFSNLGMSNVEGAICEESKVKELEREVARLLAGDGMVVAIDPEIVYERPEYADLVHATVNGAAAARTLEDRTAWIHTALVQARRIYDAREVSREGVETHACATTVAGVMAELGFARS